MTKKATAELVFTNWTGLYYTYLRKWGGAAVLGRIFNPDNRFFKLLGKLVDIIILSLFWALICSVLLPFGAATTAVYDCASHCLRKDESGPYARFFSTLKSNLVTGGVAGLIVLALGYGLWNLHGLLYTLVVTGSQSWDMAYAAFWVILVLITGVVAYWFPVLSRFEFNVGSLITTCLRLSMAHLPSTLLLGLVTTAAVIVVYVFIWPVLFVPCLWALAASLPLERIFRPYMPAQAQGAEDEDEGETE